MISFKEYLTEARMAPLYHATSEKKAYQIMETNLLKRGLGIEPDLNKQTVSLTRDFIFARNWLREGAWGPDGTGIIFQIDQQKLAQRHKIVPYSFFGTKQINILKSARAFPEINTYSKGKGRDYNFDNQFEEAVLSDIKNFMQYVTVVWVGPNTSKKTIEYAQHYKVKVKRYDQL